MSPRWGWRWIWFLVLQIFRAYGAPKERMHTALPRKIHSTNSFHRRNVRNMTMDRLHNAAPITSQAAHTTHHNMKKILDSVTFVLFAFSFAFGGSLACGQEARELSSYMLVSDDFVTRASDATNVIFYCYDQKLLTPKLAEFGLKFPDNITFNDATLYVLTISDYNQEAFNLMAGDPARHLIVVDLMKDNDFKPLKAVASGKKNSRVFLVGCTPVRDIKSFVIKTADGVQHDVKGKELKK